MNSPASDPFVPVRSLTAFAILLVVVGLFWASAKEGERTGIGVVSAATITYAVVQRFYRWRWHPFSVAADEWNAGERDRYNQRQFAQRDRLLQLSPYQFEDAVAQLFRVRYGWQATRTRYSGEGGVDRD